jgi:uncharacterized protein (DUF1778 family)
MARITAAPKDAAKLRRDMTINLRLPRQTRDLLDAAAAATGKSRTEFVVDSARRNAIDVLIDRRYFSLDKKQFEAFMRVLENPPEPNAKLKELMRQKAPWEK